MQNNVAPGLVRLTNAEHVPANLAAEALKIRTADPDDDLYDDDDEEEDDTEEDSKAEKNKEKEGRNEVLSPLSDFECILTVPRVRGFDLDAKDWCTYLPAIGYILPFLMLRTQASSTWMKWKILNGKKLHIITSSFLKAKRN